MVFSRINTIEWLFVIDQWVGSDTKRSLSKTDCVKTSSNSSVGCYSFELYEINIDTHIQILHALFQKKKRKLRLRSRELTLCSKTNLIQGVSVWFSGMTPDLIISPRWKPGPTGLLISWFCKHLWGWTENYLPYLLHST